MGEQVSVPFWLFCILVCLALVALLDRLFLPGLRWFLKRKVKDVIERLNDRLQIEIQPFKLTRRQSLIDRVVYDSQVLEQAEEWASEHELPREAAIEKVDRQVKDAVAHGAELHCGGYRMMDDGLRAGTFYSPTVLSAVTPEMLIYREETFGPVAAVIPYDDGDDVVAMANDTHYGLAAYVYTNNLSRAMRTFEALNFGIIGINDINPTAAHAPFGGVKDSGLGREGGHEGIAEYLETKLGGFAV